MPYDTDVPPEKYQGGGWISGPQLGGPPKPPPPEDEFPAGVEVDTDTDLRPLPDDENTRYSRRGYS